MQQLKYYLVLVFKGIAMGAANVIPGVSGGTIALITEIFERLINAIKSFDLTAIKLLFNGKIKEFIKYTDLYFLLSILLGVVIAIVSLARLFDYLFASYPVYIWAFFFGLVLASVYFVGRRISKVNATVIITFIIGTAIAIAISFLSKGQESDNFFYLILCGIAAICSMILPGLSGSFILFIMGNYRLVAIDAINDRDLSILFPVLIGAAGGLIAFSHILSWVFKKYKDETISILTGFILGSVSILWPWQKEEYLTDASGSFIFKDGEKVITNYSRYIPDQFGNEFWIAIACILAGIMSIWLIEKLAKGKS
jgi:putative membrane protein